MLNAAGTSPQLSPAPHLGNAAASRSAIVATYSGGESSKGEGQEEGQVNRLPSEYPSLIDLL
jgi:hypothetical protein